TTGASSRARSPACTAPWTTFTQPGGGGGLGLRISRILRTPKYTPAHTARVPTTEMTTRTIESTLRRIYAAPARARGPSAISSIGWYHRRARFHAANAFREGPVRPFLGTRSLRETPSDLLGARRRVR